MKEISKCTYEDNVQEILKSVLPDDISIENIVFVCIGTDRSTGDSLGPLVGTYLQSMGYSNVYGTVDEPVHALNIEEVMETIPKDKTIIGIDSSLGDHNIVGRIRAFKGSIKPGAGVGKELMPVGDYSISAVVNVGGFMEYFVLQNTRLSLVMKLASWIVNGISKRIPAMESLEVAASKQ
jgi:putative sporulation protein YyaC